ncbi:DUF2398 family protein [Sphaerisporangium sp. B11E5]|uniref:DUF2398 family protein n=1 Tax=Sphaerisporangium sp. B11E5 TaxID=3153563 RepID=UPI00325DEC56
MSEEQTNAATPRQVQKSRNRRAWSVEADAEVSAALRTLAAQPWLVAGRDDEMIAAVRRNLDAVRDTFARLGWPLVVERDMVRLRKSPPVRRIAWAATAPSALTCSWFFLLVAAAEAMPPKVGLGQLVTAARAAAAEAGLPVSNDLTERRAIAMALRMLDQRGVVEEMDGSVDNFVHDENAPVLLAVHHTWLSHVIANFADADPSADPAGWLALVEREPDAARRMRRRLVDDTLVHVADLDEAESDWLSRRFRGDDGEPLAAAFGLHPERRAEGAAFIVPSDAFRYPYELGPLPFPTPGTTGHAALLLCDAAALHGARATDRPGWRCLPESVVISLLRRWGGQFGAGRGGWAREDVDNPAGLAEKVRGLLSGLDLLRTDYTSGAGDQHGEPQWWFSPAAGRWHPEPSAGAVAGTWITPAGEQERPFNPSHSADPTED